jgi:hypothetical protein
MSVLGDVKNVGDRFASLVLVKRSPAIANDPCTVEVTLEYEHLIDGHNQILRTPPSGLLFGKGKTSIREKSTNFFYPNGVRDESKKTQIVVAHQFPPEETGIPASAYNKLYPKVVFQGGDVKQAFPESTYQLQGLINTNSPLLIAELVVASTNSVPWLGAKEGTWICSECGWEVNNPGESVTVVSTYKFLFEFHNNPDGWDPEVAFHDQRTGIPPAGLVEATATDVNGVLRLQTILAPTGGDPSLSWNTVYIPAGTWKVPALYRMDFDNYFGAIFDGST